MDPFIVGRNPVCCFFPTTMAPIPSKTQSYYIGIDVGTGSARASLVDRNGTTVASCTKDTITHRDPDDHRIFEQSTNNIWDSITVCIKTCLDASKVDPKDVKGISFDATCSLAVSDFNGDPVVVTKGDKLGELGDRNVILWADHRAEKEAELINSTGSIVLDYVGGTMSLEMEVPKVLWLKNHMDPSRFSRCQFFDLPDFLTYRATEDNTRSCCSVTCKCSFVPNKGWQAEFFNKIGLEQFPKEQYRQMGAPNGPQDVLTAGSPIGKGLSKKAAEEFGLVEGTPVGSGVIDAYAGWLGTVAARYKENGKLSEAIKNVDESKHRLAAVAGTSTCHIVQSKEGVFVNGVWGPYKLIDFMLKIHPAYPRLVELGKTQDKNIHAVLFETLQNLKKEAKADTLTELTKDMHFYPDLHGNRSPIADPRMRGSFVGLTLDDGLHDLARKYYLTLEAIALQTRHIVDEMNAKGHSINSIYMSGGQAKNIPMMQLFAETCGMPIILPADHAGAVVLGAAMLGRFAEEARTKGKMSEQEQNGLLWNIMVEMTPPGTIIRPAASSREKKLLEAKYKIFREQIDIQYRWRTQIEEALKD
ncbi:hypothetical protein WG66_006966 [Moniliophthora roreri]|nr:hypothetical protein WG66_006966 [Moniliophthora roreri]